MNWSRGLFWLLGALLRLAVLIGYGLVWLFVLAPVKLAVAIVRNSRRPARRTPGAYVVPQGPPEPPIIWQHESAQQPPSFDALTGQRIVR